MKIAIRGGHCPKATGAKGIIDELTEDRKVKDSLIKYLRMLGYDVLDVTPPDYTSSNVDLYYGVSKANAWGADLFISIHFNKAYDSYNGTIGTEVCVYSPFDTAQRVVNGLSSLGFKNRGQKIRTGLYELRHASMKAMIIEVCFVEATGDVALYNNLGYDLIAKTIAESIANNKVNEPVVEPPVITKPIINNTDSWIKRLQEECNKQGFSNQIIDGIAGSNTLNGCPTLRKGARGNITKLLQEKLVSLGYNTNGVDGIFGSATDNAIRLFQNSNRLLVDGIVGKNTWRKILNI